MTLPSRPASELSSVSSASANDEENKAERSPSVVAVAAPPFGHRTVMSVACLVVLALIGVAMIAVFYPWPPAPRGLRSGYVSVYFSPAYSNGSALAASCAQAPTSCSNYALPVAIACGVDVLAALDFPPNTQVFYGADPLANLYADFADAPLSVLENPGFPAQGECWWTGCASAVQCGSERNTSVLAGETGAGAGGIRVLCACGALF